MIAGTLEIQLMANIARLASDMQKAQQTVDSTMTGIQGAVGFAQKALGALGIGLSVNYFKNFVAGAIDAQDRLQDLSNRSGLAVTTLAGLDHATKMTGTSLDVMVKGLKTVSTQLYEAQQGGKSAQDMFSGLGISVLDTNGALKSSDRVLIEVADRFATMTSETEKTALATKLFGKAGTELIPMLNEGSDAIAAMVAEGQRLNPVTEESARQAASFNDNVDRLTASVKGAGTSIVNNMLPGLVKFSDAVFEVTQNGRMAEWFDRIKTAAELLAIILITRMTPAIVASGLAFIAATAESLAYQAALARMAGVSAAAAVSATALSGALMLIGGPVGAAILATAAIYKLAGAYSAHEAAIGKTLMSNNAMIEAVGLAVDENGDLVDSTDAATKAAERYRRQLAITAPAQEDAAEAINESATAVVTHTARTVEQIAELRKSAVALDHGTFSTKSQTEAVNALIDSLSVVRISYADNIKMMHQATWTMQGVTTAANDAGRATDFWTAVAEDGAERRATAEQDAADKARDNWQRTHEYLSTTFIDIANNGGNAFDNIAKSFSAMIQRMVAEWAASKLMSIFGIGGGGGGGGAASSILSSVGGSAIKSVFGGGAAAASGAAAMPGGVAATMGGGAGIMAGIGGAATAAGSAISGGATALYAAALANPAIAAALAAAALAAALSKEETPSGNAGFLIRDLAGGGDGRTFDVEPFASGFDPVGFARREDQGAAVGVIDTFRQYDAALTSIANAAGIDVNYNSNTFGGFDEKGRGNGLFFGAANEDGDGTSVPIQQQLDQYVSQWIKGLGGQVDQSLIADVLAAGSADEMVKRAGMIAGIDGSHAAGLDYVPFDGYVAELHKGERVVPASENVGSGTMSSMIAELRAMRAELIEIRKNSMDSFNLLDKWDNDPLTVQVAA